jgi:hypothetical protein
LPDGPTHCDIPGGETSFMLVFQFDDAGEIVDQWLGSNFVEILAQLGWGFAPVGEVVSSSA